MGPAIGWLEEGTKLLRERRPAVMQMIYNLLEQDPGRDFYKVGRETGTSFLIRVPHSSGLLEGKYTKDTTFDENDHRSHRKREWLVNGLKKLEKLDFLTAESDRTIGQAALKYILAEPLVASVFPNIYNEAQLDEFSKTSEISDLTAEEIERVDDLYENNFYLEEAAV
jgi:aryl-alcohol dehydrogenase-like predicted oxidoreductase